MEIKFRRELNHSYMVLEELEQKIADSYQYQMISNNQIPGLLPCKERMIEGKLAIYFDISSRQPLNQLYEVQKFTAGDFKDIFTSMETVFCNMEEYLLDERCLILRPECIFADIQTLQIYFAYNPEGISDDNQFAPLAEFFLEHVEHRDEHAVNIAYEFYKSSKTLYFSLESFLPYLEKETGSEKYKDTELAEAKVEGSKEDWNDLYSEGSEEDDSEEIKVDYSKKGRRRQKSGFSLLGRLFGKKRAKRTEKEFEEDDIKSIWDTYESAMLQGDDSETVYFDEAEQLLDQKKSRGTPCLSKIGGNMQYPLIDFPVTVGKLKGRADILLQDESVSRLHARFFKEEQDIVVMDLNSRNGTCVNGKKLQPGEQVTLQRGDIIQFGRERYHYSFIDRSSQK